MREAVKALLNQRDAAFHRAAIGNQTLASLLDGISSRTSGVRIWRGMVDDAVAEHQAIYDALATGDPALAQAAALVHISTTEKWLRDHIDDAQVWS